LNSPFLRKGRLGRIAAQRAMVPSGGMIARTFLFLTAPAALALTGCKPPPGPQSLVADGTAPGAYALAADTITVWQRSRRPQGGARFRAFSITPGGAVEYVDEPEVAVAVADTEEAQDMREQRKSFVLPRDEFEAIRAKAALLRPLSLGPDDPVGGYGGEVPPAGCALDPAQPRIAGINFLNHANWGTFVLQPGCTGERARAAAALLTELIERLDRAAARVKPTPG
jgi:hypothetical protein